MSATYLPNFFNLVIKNFRSPTIRKLIPEKQPDRWQIISTTLKKLVELTKSITLHVYSWVWIMIKIKITLPLFFPFFYKECSIPVPKSHPTFVQEVTNTWKLGTTWFEKTLSVFTFNYNNATLFSLYFLFSKSCTRNNKNFLLFSVFPVSYINFLKQEGKKSENNVTFL